MESIVNYPYGSNTSTRVVIKGSELRVRERDRRCYPPGYEYEIWGYELRKCGSFLEARKDKEMDSS